MDYKANGGFQREYEAKQPPEDIEVPLIRIPYDFMLQILIDSMKYNVDEFGRKIKAPNHFILFLNPDDRKQREKYEDELITEFRKDLLNYRTEITQTDKRDIVVEFSEDADLKRLQVGVTVEMVAPDDKLASIPVLPEMPGNQPEEINNNQTERTEISNRTPEPTDEFIEVKGGCEDIEKTDDSKGRKNNRTKPEKVEKRLLVGIFMNDNHVSSMELTDEKPLVFGRDSSPEIDCQLDDTDLMISRKHIKLVRTGEDVICEVLGTHGLDVNGTNYEKGQKIRLKKQDVISNIGGTASYKISFHQDK